MFKKEKNDKALDVKLPEQKSEVKPAQKPEVAKVKESQGLSQREAVYCTVMNVFNKSNVKFTGGKAADLITPEMRKQIVESICVDFKSNKISLRESPANKEKLSDDKLLRTYVSGLLNNWLRRDKRLNGTGAAGN